MLSSLVVSAILCTRAVASVIAAAVFLFWGVPLCAQAAPPGLGLADPSADGLVQPPPIEMPAHKSYTVGEGDILQINVWREPEASVEAAAVRSDGKISMPLIKELYVLGLEPLEISDILTRKISRFINDPEVTVIVREVNSLRVYVLGGVIRPGSLRITTEMTVLQVLAESGGLSEYAKKRKIYVLRGEGSRQERLPFDYAAVLSGKTPEQNIQVQSGDTIVVPE